MLPRISRPIYHFYNTIKAMFRYSKHFLTQIAKGHANYYSTKRSLSLLQKARPMRFASFVSPITHHYFSQTKPDQKEQELSDNHQPSSTYRSLSQRIMETFNAYLLKNKEKIISIFKKIFWVILSVGGAFYAEFKQAFFTYLFDSIKRRLKQNEEINKGKIVQKEILKDLAEEYNLIKQMDKPYADGLSYFWMLDGFIRTRIIKTFYFLESFTGNGAGSNLRRMVNEIMNTQPQIFQNFYYLNLKNPCYQLGKGREENDWQEARQLHYLLNTLICTKKTSTKPTIIVIDEMQVLEHFFENKEKQEMLSDILKQIFKLQKKSNTKVIVIGNSKPFIDRLTKLLISMGSLSLLNHYMIERPTEEDISKVVRKRTSQYQEMIELQLRNRETGRPAQEVEQKIKQKKMKFREIVDKIYKRHDNLSEVIRILRGSRINSKDYYLKSDKLKKTSLLSSQSQVFFNYNPFFTEEYEYIQEDISKKDEQISEPLPSLKKIQKFISYISQKIINQKVDYKVTEVQYDSMKDQQSGIVSAELAKRQIKLAQTKFKLLSKVYKNGYGNGEEKEELDTLSKNLKVKLHDQYQQQAYSELNRDGVLHGLVFTDKATYCAFQQFKKEKQAEKRFFWF